MLKPQITLERKLSKQIYEALQGKIVEKVLRQASTSSSDSYFRSTMEGHSFKVEKRLMPHLYEIFYGVKEKLGFNEDVDFYITGDSTVNAFSLASDTKGQPHIINVNSALIDLMDDQELSFVVGHELGHLINKDTALLRLINFIFPDERTMPIMLQYKEHLWQNLSELVADRYGYMAVPDLKVCVSAFFKMTSGLDMGKINMNMDIFLEDNLKRLDYFLKDEGLNIADHPVNPIRVQSLNLYATCKTNKELEKKMEDLIGILLKIRNTELDKYLAQFIATAGLILASADGEISQKEYHHILNTLADYQMFPIEYLDSVNDGDVVSLFNEAVKKIMQINPSMREDMFIYMLNLIISDKKLSKNEVALAYDLGENVFAYTKKEIANLFALMIQKNFSPDFEAIC